MLRTLLIQNVALIDRLELQLGAGLHVFTGETGAGKSILLDAFALVLGQRADTGLIRHGEAAARVEGHFDVGEHPALGALLESHGLPVGEELILARELNREARNRCWINGSLTTRKVLQAVGDRLVDLHGQHDHQLLMRSGTHLALVDDFGTAAHRKRLDAAREEIREYRRLRGRLDAWDEDDRQRVIERDHLEFQLREIEEAAPVAGEDEDLHAELRVLSSAEEIREDLGRAVDCLDGGEVQEGAIDLLGRAASALEAAASRAPQLAELPTRLEALAEELGDLRGDLEDQLRVVHADPARMREVEDRMSVLHRLTRKYGPDCAAVLATGERLQARLDQLAGDAHQRGDLEARVASLAGKLAADLARLGADRAKLATKLARAVEGQIRDLAMPHATVEVRLHGEDAPDGLPVGEARRRLYQDGLERAEILVATNPGEGPGALAKIASGGEISRVMLGLKAAMARLETVPIMVFDEIDAGVGGETGKRMAEKLKTVSARCQCLCVTHLPSIAAAGARHYQVSKHTAGGRTTVAVQEITGRAREEEVARMLAGDPSPEGLRLARGLLGGGGKGGGETPSKKPSPTKKKATGKKKAASKRGAPPPATPRKRPARTRGARA